MDDKVQKLLQRAIQENLSPDRVAYIMQFNGYDQTAIDAALSELSKKKRPVVFQQQYDSSDTQSQSQQVGPPAPSATEETDGPSLTPYEPVTFDQGTGGVPSVEEKDDVEVTTGDWWGNAWNGLVEGVSDFMYNFNKETGATQEQIAEFVELSKEKYPDLYRKYEQSKQSDVYAELGYSEEQIRKFAAGAAYAEYWQTHPEIENEVVPYIRQRRRELGVERDGVKIDQAVQEKLDEQFLASSVKGLASSVPAMVTSGVTMGGSFVTTSYYAADENLKSIFAENPDLEMTRGQQEAYKITVAGIEGILEKVGLSGTLKGNSMVKRVVTARVFSRLAGVTEDVGSEAFERVVREELRGVKGYLKKTANGTLSEAETGALQQLSNDLINETVNGLSGEEVFKPKDAMTILKDALYAGAQEAVGGGIISGTIGAFSNDIASQEDFDAAEEFIGKVDLVKMEQNLNKRVEEGQITEDKKNNVLEAAKSFKETLAKVPEDMDQESKRKVYQLINKKMQIQNKAAGKDSAIQKKANERVEQINEEIANIYDSQTQQQMAGEVQAGQKPGQVQQPQGGTQTATPSGVVQETKIDTRFHSPTIEMDQSGNAVIDPAKVREESFTGASVVEKGHVDAESASAINRAVTMLGEAGKKVKVRVFDSVESLLNADQEAANFYAKSGKTPKAYIKGNEMFVLTKNAVEQYNAAKGTDVEYAKQYVHEIGHPIVSSLVAADADVQSRLYNEIKEAAEAGDAVAQRALNFGKNYTMRGESTVENETVVEFLALATDKKRFNSLPRSTKQKIIDFFNSLLNAISSDVTITTDQQLYDLARDMRDAYRMQKGIKVQPATNKNYQKRSTQFSIDEGTTPGNRLFNAPLEDALTIAERYAESKGISYDPGKAFNTLNTEMSQEIAQAYDRMEHDPQNPEVKKAYQAMVDETVEQYEAILEEGYVVEINNNEPYSSSKDMIEDLRTNKRMKIFSTESGFGAEAITDDQRADNPLLRDSGFTDVNGQKLLVNDVFRFVHDFFGHAKRGNGFGPKGEENAWDVHSRMYTPLARRAMTSETRGQNSWVNFSGVNDEAFKLRDKARKLRKEGRTDEAAKLIEQVYEMMAFAEQKIGLMPEQYTRNPYIEGGDPDFSLDESTVQVREGVDVRFKSINPAFVKKREMVHAERVLSENKMFEFTGKRKIQSSADVAFLFRNMEDAASENAFAVFYTDEGDYKVIWLGTGNSTSVSVDFDGIFTAYENVAEDLGTKELNLVFVHNHPSGQLIQSKGDEAFFLKIENEVKNTSSIKLQDPIIINLDSGKYAVVKKTSYGFAAIPSKQKKAESTDSFVEVLSFGKQKLYESPKERTKLGGTAAIATYISKFKRGYNEKTGYFILNNQYQLMYSAIIDPQAGHESKIHQGIARDTRRYGNHVVLFGTDSGVLRRLKYGLNYQFSDASRTGEFSVLDVVFIEPRDGEIKAESIEYGDSIVKNRSQEIDFSLDETVVFHGGEVFSGPIDNNKPIFFSKNKRHAKSFADATNEALSEQLATLSELKLDYTKIANEEYVANKMQELNILPTDPAHLEAYENMASEPGSWEGINLYEALDIETFALEEGETESYYPVISKEDRDLLSAEMRKDGFYGFSYLDFSPEGQAGTKFPDAVMVFNPAEAIQEGVLKGGFNLDLDQEFSVSDLINTKVESKGTPRLDDISFSLDEKVKRHEGRGKIVRSKLKDFVGKVMHVTFSDRMVGGFVGKEEYLGGVYFPYITNSLWGANSVGAANKIIKAAVKNADGFRYMVIGMMNPDSHMSNLDMSTKALKELENELNSSRVTVEEGYNRIMKAFDKKALKDKFGETVEKYKGKRKTKANLIKLIDETVLSTDATFDLRRSFLETVLGKADKNLKLRFGNLPSYSTLAQMLAEPVTRGMNAGDTSFIVRTKGDLSVAEPKKGDPDYHPSYRYIVRSTEDVELVFLDGIYNVVDMFPRIEAKNLGHKDYQDKYGDNWRMRYLMYMGLGKMSTTVSDEMVEAEAKAAIDFSTDEGINWYESPEGKGDPAISRRDNLLEEAAQDLKAGRLKNYEFREMAKALSPIEPITRFFAPATTERMEEALAANKRPSLNKTVKDGEVVALRLDIPAYTGSNTWVVSIHDGKKRDGKVISYRSVARITDVVFKSNPLAALNIAGGEAKSTIGRMFGKYKNLKGKTPEAMAEDAKSIVAKIWNDKSWAQIGMNPTRASYFYDRRSGRPVVAAEEVIQIGGLVYAKNPVYTRWNDPAFEVKGYNDVDGAPIYFSADEGAGNIENLRGAIKRTLPRFAESRERILANPEAYYTKQSLKAIKENLELMTEDELLENMTADGLNLIANSGGPGKGENDISVLAAVELINRKAEAGEDVSELLVQLSKVGTTVGRMLRHFAELKSATPLGIVATIEGALSKANRIMSQSQVERLTDIAERFIAAQQKVKDLRDQIEAEFSKETESELKKATKELDKVTRELNKFTSLIVPKKTMDLLSTTIQGNLLTPISQITNVGANLFQIMTSIPVKGFETLFSKITGKFTGGNKRSFTYALLALPHAIKQGGVGVAEAIDTIIRGGASTEKIIHTGFLPGAAFLAAVSDTKFAAMVNKTLGKEVIKGDVLARMANGKISAEDRLKALYEGMFGLAPEVMFRFLALGDKPFSRFAEGMEAYQQAYRLGLKGDALKNYVKYPSKKQQKVIEEAGKRLTFQQDSKIATGFFGATNWLQKQGPIGQAIAFSLKLTMPYVKTPANIFVETLKFAVPGIGVASAIRNFQKKNFDAGSKDLAMAATGQMLVMVANTLIANGLVSGAFGDEDEDERALKYLKFPPMSINKSGLIRLLKGENPEYRDGDIFIRYDKFGIPGMVIGARVTSIKNNLTEAQQQEEGYYVGENDKGWFEPFSKVFDELGVGLGTVQFLNSQSFLTGANGLLKVLSGEASEYDVEKWMENTFRSLTAIPFPNTMSAVHRSIREYMPNLRTKSIETKFRYIVMDRLFDSEGIPIKIDMLGRKIPQTPDGVNSWYYNLVDFTKSHPVEDEPILNEIYRLYTLQEDSDLIPGFPTKLTRIPTKHPETGAKVTGWDPKKEEEYRQKVQKIQEVYAQNRAEILGELFASDVYNGLTNEKKQEQVIETLKKYDLGYVKLPKMKGMPTIKPPMEWKKMLDELNDQYFK